MTPGESFISIILVVIAYFLYHIVKQLSYLTGKRVKISFFNWQNTKSMGKKPQHKDPPEKLTN